MTTIPAVPAIDPAEDSPTLGIATDAALTNVSALATLLCEYRDQEAALEAQLSQLKQTRFKLETEDLPAAMDGAGLTSFTLTNGRTVAIEEFYDGTVPSESAIAIAKKDLKDRLRARRQFILDWLRRHNHHGIIKNEIVLSFSKGEDSTARAVMASLTKLGYEPVQTENVHPSTFKSWLKQLMQDPPDNPDDRPPLEAMGVFAGRKATVK